ncbi:MAG: imidazole glycerol phosphate synthase, glutamine amidotransferase subunit, partial [Verrucomicrobiaceae bacterium]|nr:imidazole glycerol phosphate synthase, glutamine amidotransferase subunit [Verrucomicrobiaceae bacterium]
ENLIACATDYGTSFASGIIKPNLVAVQFHPEKSQETGLKLLKNAVAMMGASDKGSLANHNIDGPH